MTTVATSTRRWLGWILRIAVLLLVAWFVYRSINNSWGQLAGHEFHITPGWLVAAGIVYAFALAPMGWFWQRALAAMDSPTPLLAAECGYFLGHIGKYVPGKAMSIVLRLAAVRRWVPSMRIALVTGLLETLTMMAVGAVLAATLAIFVLHLDSLTCLAAVAMAIISVAPTLPPVARRLSAIGLNRPSRGPAKHQEGEERKMTRAEIAEKLRAIDYRLLAKAWAAALVCWTLQALSLWCTLRAIGVDTLSPLTDLPLLIAAVGFSVVGGFMSQMPGGLGARDAILIYLLTPVCGGANAIVAAGLLRLIWLVSEFIACGILYIAAKRAYRAKPPS